MKFSDILLFASLASAAPLISPRQQEAVGPVTDAINALKDSAGEKLDELKAAAEDDNQNDPEVLKDGLDTVKQALEDAAGAIKDNTGDASGNVPRAPIPQDLPTPPEPPKAPLPPQPPKAPQGPGQPGQPGVAGVPGVPGVEGKPAMKQAGLGQEQVDKVVESVKSANEILSKIEETLDVITNKKGPEVAGQVQDNIDGVKKALVPFIEPYLQFVTSIKDGAAGGGADVGAIDDALGEIKGIVSGISEKLDVQGLDGIVGGVLGGI